MHAATLFHESRFVVLECVQIQMELKLIHRDRIWVSPGKSLCSFDGFRIRIEIGLDGVGHKAVTQWRGGGSGLLSERRKNKTKQADKDETTHGGYRLLRCVKWLYYTDQISSTEEKNGKTFMLTTETINLRVPTGNT